MESRRPIRMPAALVAAALLTTAVPPVAAQDPGATRPAPETAPPPAAVPAAPAVEHGATASEALAFFMASRDYRTIRDLKSIMTAGLKAAYDKDPTPFNGKKGIRLSEFDYREPVLKPAAKSAAVTVTSLWEDQGEAVDLRTETVRLAREGDGPWRVAAVEKTGGQPVRFKEAVAGVTSLRMVLRAWVKRDFETAKGLMTEAFLKRQAGRDDGIEAAFTGDPGVRRAGFRILEVTPQGAAATATAATAKVRLIESPPGRPGSLEGTPRTILLAKKGQRWLVDDWR